MTTLAEPGKLTVFAPDDTAFAKHLTAINKTIVELLKVENYNKVQELLKNHIVKDRKIMSADFREETLNTLNGDLKVEIDNGKPKFGVVMAEIVSGMGDKEAENGVVHVINKVLTGNTPTT